MEGYSEGYNAIFTHKDGRQVLLNPVFCEITGKQLCWATDIPSDKPGFTPAYISFEIVNDEGEQVVNTEGLAETL